MPKQNASLNLHNSVFIDVVQLTDAGFLELIVHSSDANDEFAEKMKK